MNAVKLKGEITQDRRLVVEVPRQVPAGAVEVILLTSSSNEPAKRRKRRKAGHPAFGIWAKRTDIADSATYAAQLRQRVEKRTDGKRRE